MIIVLDCNIWISLALTRQMDFLAGLSDSGVVIASCSALRKEVQVVLQRPKISKFVDPGTAGNVMALHDLITTSYRPGRILPVTADPKDDYLFALSRKSGADYLVTGDKLLLAVGHYHAVKVISLYDFKALLA